MKQRIIIVLLATFAFFAHIANAETLNAIRNNLGSDYAVTISGQVSKPIQGWWSSDIEQGLTLPQTVQVVYKGTQYNIDLKREFALSSCDGISISAAPTGAKENLAEPKTICIPNAESQIVGQKTDYYQRILLALDPKATVVADELPFNFAISSWTSTKYPWFDKSNQSKQTVSFANDDQGNSFAPLAVMQGYAAWGGGILPRKNHGFIGHIYNASDLALAFVREVQDTARTAAESLANFNFKKIVLPFSAVPLAGVWIPKNNSDQISLNDNQVFIYAISIGKQPPVGPYSFMTDVAGKDTDVVQKDVNDIIADREKSFPSQVAKITGQPDIKDSFSDTTRYKSNFFYSIATNAKGKVIVTTYKKDEKGSTALISSKDAGLAVLPGGISNYFKLIARPSNNPETEGPLTLDLTQLKDRKKLFE